MAEKGGRGGQSDKEDTSNGAPHSSNAQFDDPTALPNNQTVKLENIPLTESLKNITFDKSESSSSQSSDGDQLDRQADPAARDETSSPSQSSDGGQLDRQADPTARDETSSSSQSSDGDQLDRQADPAARDETSSEEVPIGAEASNFRPSPPPLRQNPETGADNETEREEGLLGVAAGGAAENAKVVERRSHPFVALSLDQLATAFILLHWRYREHKDGEIIAEKLMHCSFQPPPEVDLRLLTRLGNGQPSFEFFAHHSKDSSTHPADMGLREGERDLLDSVMKWLQLVLQWYENENPKSLVG